MFTGPVCLRLDLYKKDPNAGTEIFTLMSVKRLP